MKIIFLGAQGSGKSTQAQRLAEKLNLPCLEMGQLLRDKAQSNDSQSLEIRESLQAGNLVADEITTKTLEDRIQLPDCQNGFILDGYPRNYAQLAATPKDINLVFYINISDRSAFSRLLNRGRADDTMDLISRRLELYHKSTEPLLAYFKQQNILEELNGEKSIEEIQTEINTRLENQNNPTLKNNA